MQVGARAAAAATTGCSAFCRSSTSAACCARRARRISSAPCPAATAAAQPQPRPPLRRWLPTAAQEAARLWHRQQRPLRQSQVGLPRLQRGRQALSKALRVLALRQGEAQAAPRASQGCAPPASVRQGSNNPRPAACLRRSSLWLRGERLLDAVPLGGSDRRQCSVCMCNAGWPLLSRVGAKLTVSHQAIAAVPECGMRWLTA